MNGGRRICFTDSKGKALFSIPDGKGEDGFALCRYLDETHARIDGVDYLIREFAQRMERNGISYAAA